jgi:hypothetical protein
VGFGNVGPPSAAAVETSMAATDTTIANALNTRQIM